MLFKDVRYSFWNSIFFLRLRGGDFSFSNLFVFALSLLCILFYISAFLVSRFLHLGNNFTGKGFRKFLEFLDDFDVFGRFKGVKVKIPTDRTLLSSIKSFFSRIFINLEEWIVFVIFKFFRTCDLYCLELLEKNGYIFASNKDFLNFLDKKTTDFNLLNI